MPPQSAPKFRERPLLLFDGVCGLCNRTVDFVIARDSGKRFLFAPLQSPAGADALRSGGLAADYFESVVLLHGDKVYTRSTAALQVVRLLGGPASLLYVLILVPRVLRDWAYDFVARRRYRWFGKRDACRLPTPAEREQLLFDSDPG